MSPVLKGLLVTAGVYGGSVVLYCLWLMVGALAAGTGRGSRVGMAMLATQLVGTATFLAGIALVYRTLGRVGATRGGQLAGTLGYGLLAIATLAILILLTFVAFNR